MFDYLAFFHIQSFIDIFNILWFLLARMYSLWTNQNHTKKFCIDALVFAVHSVEVEVKNKYDNLV